MVKETKKKIVYPRYKIERILYCDKCGAEMYRDNIVLTSYPVQFCYYCPVCGETHTDFEEYDNVIKSRYYPGAF